MFVIKFKIQLRLPFDREIELADLNSCLYKHVVLINKLHLNKDCKLTRFFQTLSYLQKTFKV